MKIAEIICRLVTSCRSSVSGAGWPWHIVRFIAVGAPLALLMPAAGQIQPEWTRSYDTPRNDFAAGLVLDGRNNVCVLVDSSGGFATLKYSPDGTLLWTDTYDSSQETPTAIAADAAGQVWVTGIFATNGPSGNIVTIKYTADGTRLWVRSSDETNAALTHMVVTVDALGNSYVAGISRSSGSSVVAIKYDSGGTPSWIRRYAAVTGYVAEVTHAALDSAGNLLVIGNMRGVAGPTKLVLLKYNQSGDFVSAGVNDLETSNDFVSGAAADPDGNVYVTGAVWHGDPIRYNFLTAKYSPEGALLWSVLHPPAYGYHAVARALKLDPDRNVIVTGYETRPLDEDEDAYDGVTIKYSPNGTQLWSARSTFQRSPHALALDADGNIYVAGISSPSFSPVGTFLLKYAPNGSQLWYTNLPSVLFEQFAVGGSGELYLTDGIFADSAAVETRKFVQTPVVGQPTATIVPALTEALIGSSVTLTAVVSGPGPFTYHWQYFGSNCTGETNATLTKTNVLFEWGTVGNYTVIVSNAAGYTISPEARITVLVPPFIRLQIATHQYASIGQQVTFAAYAVETEPFSYQWHFNGNPISGATSNVFTLANMQVTNVGDYIVTVTNRAGSATSDVIRLVLVLPPVSITNMATIQINSNNVMPYPSELFVHDVTGNVLKVTVTLCGLTHPYPDDLTVLVQGPTGQSVLLMSGVAEDDTANDVTLTFDDDALSPLTPYRISSGTFKPSIYGGNGPLPPPAPAEWDATLSVFSGADPNGTWRLFVSNAYAEVGEIARGWRVTLFIADPNATGGPRITSIVRVGDHVLLQRDGTLGQRLQRTSSLTNPMWTDVPDSEGQSSIELLMGSASEFFRLVKP